MKKLLILIAIFASLLTCFNACSDNAEEVTDPGCMIKIYYITGFLSYDDNANKYALDVHDVYIANESVTHLLDSLSKDKVYIEPRFTVFEDQLEEFVGSEITTIIDEYDVGRFFGNGMLSLHSRINAATVESAQRTPAQRHKP